MDQWTMDIIDTRDIIDQWTMDKISCLKSDNKNVDGQLVHNVAHHANEYLVVCKLYCQSCTHLFCLCIRTKRQTTKGQTTKGQRRKGRK